MSRHLFVGDSLTVGEIGSTAGAPADVALTAHVGYRALAAAALHLDAVGPFVDPTGRRHGAIGGASSATFLDEGDPAQTVAFVNGPPAATWMARYRPDTVSIMLGTNDGRAENPERTVDRIGILVTAANALHPATRFFLCSILANSPWTRAFNAALAARTHAPGHFSGPLAGKVTFLDASKKANAILSTDPAAITAAGHWNARGYRDVADAFVEGWLDGTVTIAEVPHSAAGTTSPTGPPRSAHAAPAARPWLGRLALAGLVGAAAVGVIAHGARPKALP